MSFPEWNPESDWLHIRAIDQGTALTYQRGGGSISFLVMGLERSQLFSEEMLPRTIVNILDEKNEVTDEDEGLLLGTAVDGLGIDIVRQVPPTGRSYAPIAIELLRVSGFHEGVLVFPPELD